MEFSTLSLEVPRNRSRRLTRTVGGAAVCAVGVGLLIGCGGDEGESHFVDCQQTPGGSVSATIDTLHESTVYIGDAEANADGDPKWRDKVTVDSRGGGEFDATADGFGPILHYNEVAAEAEPVELFRDTQTGSRITAAAPPTEDVTKSAPIVVAFHC